MPGEQVVDEQATQTDTREEVTPETEPQTEPEELRGDGTEGTEEDSGEPAEDQEIDIHAIMEENQRLKAENAKNRAAADRKIQEVSLERKQAEQTIADLTAQLQQSQNNTPQPMSDHESDELFVRLQNEGKSEVEADRMTRREEKRREQAYWTEVQHQQNIQARIDQEAEILMRYDPTYDLVDDSVRKRQQHRIANGHVSLAEMTNALSFKEQFGDPLVKTVKKQQTITSAKRKARSNVSDLVTPPQAPRTESAPPKEGREYDIREGALGPEYWDQKGRLSARAKSILGITDE